MTTRRQFVLTAVPAVALALGGARAASAQPAKLEESDPSAVALGYKMDATKVDAKKFTTYAAGHMCSNCQFYSGKAGDATDPEDFATNRMEIATPPDNPGTIDSLDALANPGVKVAVCQPP